MTLALFGLLGLIFVPRLIVSPSYLPLKILAPRGVWMEGLIFEAKGLIFRVSHQVEEETKCSYSSISLNLIFRGSHQVGEETNCSYSSISLN